MCLRKHQASPGLKHVFHDRTSFFVNHNFILPTFILGNLFSLLGITVLGTIIYSISRWHCAKLSAKHHTHYIKTQINTNIYTKSYVSDCHGAQHLVVVQAKIDAEDAASCCT